MSQRHLIADEFKRLTVLALPVIATQIGAMLLGVVDTIMLGRFSLEALDAAALGNVWLWGTMIFGMGVAFGLDPIVSHAHGAGDGKRVGRATHHGIVTALLVSIPLGLLWLMTEPVLVLFGQDAQLAAQAHEYVVIQIPSLAFFLVFNTLRQYLQGRGIVAPALWVMLAANVFNAAVNYALIFGNWGAPEMGLAGAGIATALTRTFALVGLALWIRARNLHLGAWVPWSRASFSWAGIREVLGYGVPVGLQYLLEGWAFQIATLMAGTLGRHELGAHSIVLNMASVAFMMPLGVSIAAAARIGNLIGAKKISRARVSAWVSVGMGAGFMSISALTFIVLRDQLALLYTEEEEVVWLAASILPIAACFQLVDGIQVVGGGVLRGFGKTRPAAVFNFVGYYLLALPVAALLTFGLGWRLEGIWWALAVGLSVVAVLLCVWIKRIAPKD
jgi:MATE family multidrug resistance protein